MARMKDLVLGGEGLIGSTLIGELNRRGHETVSLDLKSGCDLRYVDDEPFRNCDRVWFLAWDTGGVKYIEAADSQHEQFKHNSELCARVFDALFRTRTPFLFVSSQLAGLPNAYGMTKAIAANWSLQLGGKVARLWNTYGWEHPSRRSHVITDLVLSALTSKHVACQTNGRERRRFIYKSDCVEALIALADSSQQTAEIAGGEWVTIARVAEEIARQTNAEIALGQRDGSEVMIDPDLLLPNWQPKVDLSEGIAKVIRDARAYLAVENGKATKAQQQAVS
ncbi:MAG: hypothetical protein DMF72_04600 [Acidobacteria bacterium]|nr:MAG: hypothetical protein DMF72_04600 [Acidobacteriota bacterium]